MDEAEHCMDDALEFVPRAFFCLGMSGILRIYVFAIFVFPSFICLFYK